jgi:molybdenum cofactor cytidylyltransferase
MRFAILPAAGHSRRMGRPKLTLPLGDRIILEHVIAALRQAEVEHILVVVGPHVPQMAVMAERAGASVCRLSEETHDMRATVERGLDWLEELFQPHPDDAWLLVPADHPALDPPAIHELDRARRNHPDFSIFVPTYRGQRGHPLLLTWRHVEGIRAHPHGQGLNVYVRSRAAQTLEVPVESETILWDLDTPEDYQRFLRDWESNL